MPKSASLCTKVQSVDQSDSRHFDKLSPPNDAIQMAAFPECTAVMASLRDAVVCTQRSHCC